MAKQATKVKKTISTRKGKSSSKVNWEFPLVRKNFMIIGLGLIIILLGYGAMATGLGDDYAAVDGNWNNPLAISIGPLLLVIGYCVVIPYGIWKFFGKSE